MTGTLNSSLNIVSPVKPGHNEGRPGGGPQDFHAPPDPPPRQEIVRLTDVMSRLDSLAGLSEKMDSMAEDFRQLRAIQDTTNNLVREMSETKDKVTELQATVSTFESREKEIQLNQQAIAKELLDLKQAVQQLQAQQPQQQPASSDFDLLKVKADMPCLNLIIEGIREPRSGREGSTRHQVYNFCRNVLRLSHVDIDTAYRLGKPRPSSAPPRPMFVRFSRLCDREDVWRAKSRLSDQDFSHFSIKEDLPVNFGPSWRRYKEFLQAARRYPEKYNVSIRDYKIYVNGIAYEVKDLEKLPKDIRPSHISTPGNTKSVVFFGKDSKFSNHYSAPFVVDDTKFATMEQFLAHSRARFANNQNRMDRAMDSLDPAEAKS